VANGAAVISAPSGAPSSRKRTPTTPTLSLAVADTVTVPDTVAPATGAVIETVGGVLSLKSVTLTAALVVWFPAASRATAVREWAAFVADPVFHDVANGAVVTSAPSGAPSKRKPTATTPTLSLAVADTVTVPDSVAPVAGAVIETVGGVVSLNTVMLTAALVVIFPAASRATAVREWAAFVADPVLQDVVNGGVVTSAPSGAPSNRKPTPTTPTLSLAVADTVTVPDSVAPVAGPVIETVGGVVSLNTVTLTAALVVIFPAASRASAERE
jgi:hypothetical protein